MILLGQFEGNATSLMLYCSYEVAPLNAFNIHSGSNLASVTLWSAQIFTNPTG